VLDRPETNRSMNQRRPSEPEVIEPGHPMVANGVTAPLVVMRVILCKSHSVIQRLPSAPTAMEDGSVEPGDRWNSVTTPAGVMRQIRLETETRTRGKARGQRADALQTD